MRSKTIAQLVSIVIALMWASAISAMDTGPQGVSPGAIGRLASINSVCPTFTWESTPSTELYELVVYRVDAESSVSTSIELTPENEALSMSISGRASAWTPESEDCFAPGESYVWFVRAITDTDTGEGSEWSEPRFFEVAAAPSAEELERAIEVIRRWEAATGDGSLPLTAAAVIVPDAVADSGPGSGSTHLKSVTTGTAAIRGEQPDLSGETYGVVGTSASPDGAGIGAANTAGGPDLVLDGAVPAEFSEEGVDRPSASPQTFSFSNTGGGGMMLNIEGIPVVTTATDQDTVGALTCGSGQLAKWTGASWVCAPDLDTDTLSGLNCATWQIPKWNGSIWECNYDWDTLYNLGCGPGQIAKYIDATAGWECAEDRDTTYSLGPGLINDDGEIRIDPAEFTTQVTTIEIAGSVDPDHLSLAVGADGLGLIAYYDSAAQLLRVLHCLNPTCTGVEVNTPDTTTGAGMYPSVAIGTDGRGIISYWAGAVVDNLRVAHCDNLACTSATINSVSAQCGKHSSIAIGSDGFPLIAYASDFNGLEVAHCLDADCALLEFGLPQHGVGSLTATSIAIGGDGLGLIAVFWDGANTYYKIHCDDPACGSSTISTLAVGGNEDGEACSVTIGEDGYGLIAYVYNALFDDLKVAHCLNASCTSTNSHIGFGSGHSPSMILGSNNRGLMAYGQGGLNVVPCIDLTCANSTTTLVDVVSSGKISAATGPDGRTVIAYVDGTTLKVARLPVGY